MSVQERRLGCSEWAVSVLSLGTVSLGLEYGIPKPGQSKTPSPEEAIRLIEYAADRGISLFDTAPTYGRSEELLGRALGGRSDVRIATKVSIPKDHQGELLRGKAVRKSVFESLERSLRHLKRDCLDIVQIHNADSEVIRRGEVGDCLEEAHRQGKLGLIGASVYGEGDALAAIERGVFDVLQVAFNLLDQSMGKRVFCRAAKEGIGILARSIYMKGVLTPKAEWLPGDMLPLREAADRVRRHFDLTWKALPEIALRFCLGQRQVSSLLVGVRSSSELDLALAAAEKGPLKEAPGVDLLSVHDQPWVNPATWPIP